MFSVIRVTFFLALTLIFHTVFSQGCPPNVSYIFEDDVHDYSGNGYGAVLFAGADVSEGYLETGLNDDDYASIPPAVLDGAGDFTISFRFLIHSFNTTGSSPTNSIIAGATSGNEAEFAIAYEKSSSSVSVALGGDGQHFVTDIIEEETWYCLTMIRDGADVSVYIDGTLIHTYAINDDPIDITFLQIGQELDCGSGCFVANQCLNGAVDDLVIYSCVQEDLACTAYILPCDTTLLYDFNGNVTDHSGNGYDGTLNAGANVSSDYLITGLNNTDYVEIPVDALNSLNDFVLSFNFKIAAFNTTGSSPTNSIIAGINNTAEAEFALAYQKSTNTFVVALKDDAESVEADIQPDVWYCLTLERSGTVVHLRLNGTELTPGMSFDAGPLDLDFFEIGQEVDCVAGCFAENQSFNGAMDNLIITDCAEVQCSDFPDAIISLEEDKSFTVFPDPAVDYILIRTTSNNTGTLKILNLNGENVSTHIISNIETVIDISNLTSGLYIVECNIAGKVYSQKLIKL